MHVACRTRRPSTAARWTLEDAAEASLSMVTSTTARRELMRRLATLVLVQRLSRYSMTAACKPGFPVPMVNSAAIATRGEASDLGTLSTVGLTRAS